MLNFLNKNNVSELNSDNIAEIVLSLKPIDVSGADSDVYKFGNKAIHHYEDTPPEKVELYADLVHKSKNLLDGQKTKIDDKLITLNILPVQDLIKTKNDGVFTVAEFIPGDNLYIQLKNGVISRTQYNMYEM